MILDEIVEFIRSTGVTMGLLSASCRHTSASVIIQENVDPTVQIGLSRFFGAPVDRQEASGASPLQGFSKPHWPRVMRG